MIKLYAPLHNTTFEELGLPELLADANALTNNSWVLVGIVDVEKGEVPGFAGGNPEEIISVWYMRSRAARVLSAIVPVGMFGIVVEAA